MSVSVPDVHLIQTGVLRTKGGTCCTVTPEYVWRVREYDVALPAESSSTSEN